MNKEIAKGENQREKRFPRIEARKGSREKKLDPYVGLRERSMNKERRKRES